MYGIGSLGRSRSEISLSSGNGPVPVNSLSTIFNLPQNRQQKPQDSTTGPTKSYPKQTLEPETFSETYPENTYGLAEEEPSSFGAFVPGEDNEIDPNVLKSLIG